MGLLLKCTLPVHLRQQRPVAASCQVASVNGAWGEKTRVAPPRAKHRPGREATTNRATRFQLEKRRPITNHATGSAPKQLIAYDEASCRFAIRPPFGPGHPTCCRSGCNCLGRRYRTSAATLFNRGDESQELGFQQGKLFADRVLEVGDAVCGRVCPQGIARGDRPQILGVRPWTRFDQKEG